VRYGELAQYLKDHGHSNPNLSDVREAVLTLRRRKAMVIDSSDADSRSVGSFFVNPVVEAHRAEEIRVQAARLEPNAPAMPQFQQPGGAVKLSAAWLIERSGIHRGFAHGNVATSTKHALAITNRGGGTAREVIQLKELIQKRVRDVFGVELVPEPVFVGLEG
jgi:UDP-N-acetylmuramate dehydrogenase